MSSSVMGALVGAVLAWALLSHGLGGLLLMALFLGVGYVVGGGLGGRVDVRGVMEALRGRRGSS